MLKTWGDHVRKCRLEQNLLQRQVAKVLGVNTTTITNWEKHRREPRLHLIPKILEFLGYHSFPQQPKDFGERIMEYRRRQGLNRKKLARDLGIDPTTLARWEKGKASPSRKLREHLTSFFESLG